MEESLFCPKAIEIVNKLFTIFFAICNGFESQFSNTSRLKMTKAQWVMAFMEENITEWTKIENALVICRKKENLIYIPSIGDFLSWCKKSPEKTFISKERAYVIAYDLMRNELSESFSDDQMLILRHAIKSSDSHFLKNNSRYVTEPVFCRNYEIALRDFLQGTLKPIPKAIEKKEKGDSWKQLKQYGVLPQYAHLTNRHRAMPVIEEILKKNGGKLTKELPYDKQK